MEMACIRVFTRGATVIRVDRLSIENGVWLFVLYETIVLLFRTLYFKYLPFYRSVSDYDVDGILGLFPVSSGLLI